MVIAVRPPYKIMSLAVQLLLFLGLEAIVIVFVLFFSLSVVWDLARAENKNENKMLTEMRALSGQIEFTMTQ